LQNSSTERGRCSETSVREARTASTMSRCARIVCRSGCRSDREHARVTRRFASQKRMAKGPDCSVWMVRQETVSLIWKQSTETWRGALRQRSRLLRLERGAWRAEDPQGRKQVGRKLRVTDRIPRVFRGPSDSSSSLKAKQAQTIRAIVLPAAAPRVCAQYH
jgi:hypothetical protein